MNRFTTAIGMRCTLFGVDGKLPQKPWSTTIDHDYRDTETGHARDAAKKAALHWYRDAEMVLGAECCIRIDMPGGDAFLVEVKVGFELNAYTRTPRRLA